MSDVTKENKEKTVQSVEMELLTLKKPLTNGNVGDEYIFKSQLDQAHSNIESILNQVNSGTSNENGIGGAYVFGVSGERGSGKTSFLNILKAQIDSGKNENIKTLDIIDPGVISKSLSLVEILVAKIYQDITNKHKKSYENKSCNELFNNLKSAIQVMADLKGGRENFYVDVPNMEILKKIDNQSSFEFIIKKLVTNYLEVALDSCSDGDKADKKKKMLILLIDDLDMVGRNEISYMLEDIRKYLPDNVLAILSYRESQLLSNVCQDKLWENKQLLHAGEVTMEDIRLQSVRYLEKLIPMDFRIRLLNQSDLNAQPIISLLQNCPQICKRLALEQECTQTFEDFVADFIYERSRIQIKPISQKERTRYYLPGNLRGMIQLLSVLVKMEPINHSVYIEKQRDIISQNIIVFQSFFIQRAEEILDTPHGAIIETWDNERMERKHFYIYHEVRKKVLALEQDMSSGNARNVDKLNILFKADSSLLETYNLTIANVYSVLEIYKDTAKDEMVYHFVYIMKVLYSIQLLQQVLNGYQTESFIKYQDFVGGKIIPDDFTYNSRKTPESFYIRLFKNQWNKLNQNQQDLIDKMAYTDASRESSLRTDVQGKSSYNRYPRMYNIDLVYRDSKFSTIPLDPFAVVLKTSYLNMNQAYTFYSMFDIDIILRANFGRDNSGDILSRLNHIVLYSLHHSIKDEKNLLNIIADNSILKMICNQIFRTDKLIDERSQLYTEDECKIIDSLLLNGEDIDITKADIIRNKEQGKIFIKILLSRIEASTAYSDEKKIWITQLTDILEVLEKPKTKISMMQRNDIEKIKKAAEIIIRAEEIDSWRKE